MRALFLQDEEVGVHSVRGPAVPVNTLALSVFPCALFRTGRRGSTVENLLDELSVITKSPAM